MPVFATDEEKYTTKYDSFEIDAILRNPRLIKAYLNCGLGRGPCLKEGNLLKGNKSFSWEIYCEYRIYNSKVFAKEHFKYVLCFPCTFHKFRSR